MRRVPADAAERTLIALDCGSALRIDRRGEVAGQFARVVNIDHHHDNTLFGTVNLVDAEASCTAEIVAGLLDEAGIPLAEGAPLALYVGLVTDTGPLPVRQHDAARAPSRGAAAGGGRAARAGVLDALRVAAALAPAAARAGARARAGRGRRPPRGDLARARRLRVDGRRRRRLRRRRRRAARDRGRRAGGARARAARSQRPRAQGLAALARRRASTARRSRASGAGAGTPAPPGTRPTSRSRRSWPSSRGR